MNKKVLISVILFCFVGLVAQAQPAMDTIKNCLKQKPELFAKFYSRNTFISNTRAKTLGVKLGLSYGGRLHYGLGYNQLTRDTKNFDKQIYYTNDLSLKDSTTASLHMFYISAFVEYVFYQTKHWNLSMPLQIGVGQTAYKYELFGRKKVAGRGINFIYEPAVSIGYKFVKWIGVGADIGFRFMLSGNKKLDQKFNSPTYAFKVLIYYSEIYKSLFPKNAK